MNVRYEHKKAMTFIGFSTSIRPDEGYEKCPQFWENEYSRRFARLWQTMTPETPVEKAVLDNQIGMFAICDEKNSSFDYWIARRRSARGTEALHVSRKRLGDVFRKGRASEVASELKHAGLREVVPEA